MRLLNKLRSKSLLITLVLFIVSGCLALYFFVRTQVLQNELKATWTTVAEQTKTEELLASLQDIDDMLLQGQYQQALKAYENQYASADSTASRIIEKRIQLTRSLMTMRQKIYENNSSTDDTAQVDSTAIALTPTPDEIRRFDSLLFAMEKVKVQLDNAQRQLKQKAFGEYLTFTNSKGNTIYYVGEVRNNKANGKGVALYSTGSRYQGSWKDNQRHGYGTFYWPDGERYDGDYVNDRREGVGTYFWPNGEKFAGGWKNDRRSGKGAFYSEDGEIMASGIWKGDELVEVD
jgi:hypothetical protein